MLDYKWRLTKLCWMAKNRSETYGVDFDLCPEYLIGLWEETEGLCSVTGLSFDLEKADKGKVNPKAPSVDRIIPELGYTQGNIRLVTYQANVAMNEFGADSLEEFCKAYLLHNNVAFN